MATFGNKERSAARLKGWKEIAAFFGTDERTAKRWEKKRGLPVRRLPGGARSTVYAEIADLQGWMAGGNSSALTSSTASRHRWLTGVVLVLGLVAAVAVGLRQFAPAARILNHRPSETTTELYLAGVYNFERRTPESLNRAVELFNRAIAADPAYAEPYAGLARTNLLLREYAAVPDALAYPRARDFARQALALNPGLTDARLSLAFVTFYWDRDFGRGLSEFARCVAQEPNSPRGRHWYATALYHAGRMPDALTQIDEAQRLNPESQAILADKGLILFHAGRRDEAVDLLEQVESSDPAFLSPHAYLAEIHLAQRDFPGWLRENRLAAASSKDPRRMALAEAAFSGWRSHGEAGALRALLAELQRPWRGGGKPSYEIAATRALLGEREAALRQLEEAWQSHDPGAPAMRVDPRLLSLHGDPRFETIAARLR